MIEFGGLPDNVHHCTSHRDGDCITWICPLCPGYIRLYNLKSGKMSVRGKTDFQHVGVNSNDTESNILIPLSKAINNREN